MVAIHDKGQINNEERYTVTCSTAAKIYYLKKVWSNKRATSTSPKNTRLTPKANLKKCDLTGLFVSFGQNTREYIIKVSHKITRINRHFPNKIEVKAISPVKQPAQASSRPGTP
jgi:hypothetical protein